MAGERFADLFRTSDRRRRQSCTDGRDNARRLFGYYYFKRIAQFVSVKTAHAWHSRPSRS